MRVFALSLTLLVVALEVPKTSAELMTVFWQFPAFALCFGFMMWVWYEHFLFHRRFGFEDALTIALNGLLLFFFVFYVFPLKFLASALVTAPLEGGSRGVVFGSHGTAVMVFYSAGFVGIFTVLALMYWRARLLSDGSGPGRQRLPYGQGRRTRRGDVNPLRPEPAKDPGGEQPVDQTVKRVLDRH